MPDIDYQTLVFVMDAVGSYKTVVAASEVNAVLFPEVSLGDAPFENNPAEGAESAAEVSGEAG